MGNLEARSILFVSALRKRFLPIWLLNSATPFLFYVLITLFMVCVPIGFDFTGRYFGYPGEAVLWSNYFWWFDYSITHLLTNPLHDSYLFYPLGLDMVDSILPLMLFLPVTYILGSVVSYNLYLLLNFILAAFGMYLLVEYLLKDKYIAFVSGLIFSFSPFHFASSLAHLHVFSIMWIPFFVLFFLKMYEEPTQLNVILSSIFFSINALTSWTIALMISIFILLFLMISYKQIILRSNLYNFILFATVSFILMSPGLYIILKNYINNEHMVKGISDFITFSADIFGFITPSPFNSFFGVGANNIYSNFTGNLSENIVFMGYSVIILSIICLIYCRNDNMARIFMASFGIFFILSLGPVLHINGHLTIMLPGVITAYLPIFNMIRVPSRYDLMVMFCLAIIAGYGIKSLCINFCLGGYKKILLCILLSLIVLFEFSAVMPTQAVMPIPDFYHNISQEEDNSIIELPIIRSDLDSPGGVQTMIRYYEYQKVHHQKLFGGYFDRVNPVYAQFSQSDPVFSFLYSGRDIVSQQIPIDLYYLKSKYDADYVVLHIDLLSPEYLNELVKYMGKSYTIDDSVKSDRLIIYSTMNLIESNDTQSGKIQLQLGDGFNNLENWAGTPTRWMQDNSTLKLSSLENHTVNLRLNAQSFYRPRMLEVYAGNELTSQVAVPTSFINVSVPMRLSKGENIVRFHVPEGCERPCDIPQLKNPDSRCLSLAIQNITLTEKKTAPFEYLSGFYSIENWTGTPTRWMQSDAVVIVNSPENHTVNLRLNAQSFYRNRMLDIYAGDDLSVRSSVPPSGFMEVEAPIYLLKGANTVRLYVPEGCERPCDKPELNNPDSRCLSLAIQKITLEEKKTLS